MWYTCTGTRNFNTLLHCQHCNKYLYVCMCVYLFLQWSELRGHTLQPQTCLLHFLMGGSHQMAVPISRLTGILQLHTENTGWHLTDRYAVCLYIYKNFNKYGWQRISQQICTQGGPSWGDTETWILKAICNLTVCSLIVVLPWSCRSSQFHPCRCEAALRVGCGVQSMPRTVYSHNPAAGRRRFPPHVTHACA